MPARDAFGRPVPHGSPRAVEPLERRKRTAAEAVTDARALLAAGRPFFAHEVLEEQWKVAPAGQRALWQGLAQVCVGLTHLQRDNRVGAARLLRRGAGLLGEVVEAGAGPAGTGPTGAGPAGADPAGIDVAGLQLDLVIAGATDLAAAIEAGAPARPLMF